MLLLKLYIDHPLYPLEILIESINKEKKYMYMIGDYNIFTESGYYNMIDKPTRTVDINISNQNQNARNIYYPSG